MGKSSAKVKAAASPKRRRGLMWYLPWALASIPICVVLWPSVFLVAALMGPSVLSPILFGRRAMHLTASVGILNFVGVLPALGRLWEQGHVAGVAAHMLTDPVVWGGALAGAGTGLVLFFATEWVVAAYYRITAEARLSQVMARQEELVELWGDEVITADAARLMTQGGQATPGEPGDLRAGAAT